MMLYIHFRTSAGLQNTKIYFPNNKNITELKAIVARKITLLKGKEFYLGTQDEVYAGDVMVRTKVSDGGGLSVSLPSQECIDVEEDPMEEDDHEGQIAITWGHLMHKKTFWMFFNAKDKTGQDLKDAITKFLDKEGQLKGDFSMKHIFHLIPLAQKLNWENDRPSMAIELDWGAAYVSSTQTATIL
jgi:hypothetical protein